MQPKHGASLHVVADNSFVFVALLLCDRTMTCNCETRPSWTDRLPPKCLGWLCGPVGCQAGTGRFAVAAWPEELRKRQLGQGMSGRLGAGLGRLAFGRGQGALGPAPLEEGHHVSAELAEAEAGGKQDGYGNQAAENDQPGALGQAGEKKRPGDEKDCSDGDAAQRSEYPVLLIVAAGRPNNSQCQGEPADYDNGWPPAN